MKRTHLIYLGILQIVVIVFLVLALTRHEEVWYLATAGSVTVLLLLAAAFGLRNLFPSE